MAAFLGLDDFVQQATGANVETFCWLKEARQAGAAANALIAGRPHSLWTYDGNPSAGVAPGATAVIPTNATNGALKQTDPGGGREKWLTMMATNCRTIMQGRTTLYDRLSTISGLDGTNTGTQTTSGMAVTRNTGGVGNELWIEIYTALGGTARTITASYKNESGATHTTVATAIGGTNDTEATRMIQLPLQAGDRGVTDCISVTLSATTGTAGDFGVTILNPLAQCNQADGNSWGLSDFIIRHPGPVKIAAGACLALQYVGNAVGAPQLMTFFNFVEK